MKKRNGIQAIPTAIIAGIISVTLVVGIAGAAAFSSPPSNAIDILWADYCGRISDSLCATPTPSPSPTPSPTPVVTPSPTPVITPSPTPVITPSPTPTATPVVTPSPTPVITPSPTPPTAGSYIIMSRANLLALPTSGAAWQGVLSWAAKTPDVNLGDLNSNGDIIALAKGLVYARTGDAAKKTEVIQTLDKVRASGISRALELGRGLGAYVLAADLVDYRDSVFLTWVGQQFTRPTSGGPTNLNNCASIRPNNWGTWCRSSVTIAHIYLGQSITNDIAMFRGWLGERSQYAGFTYGDLSWQCNSSTPVGVNPVGCLKSGHLIDGVLPDDQRRAGNFSWPPPCENYVAEALQGTTLEAIVLERAGNPSWDWSSQAIKRAVDFKYNNNCSFTGDDSFIPFVIDAKYGTDYAGSIPAQPGKGSGYYDWLFQ